MVQWMGKYVSCIYNDYRILMNPTKLQGLKILSID